MLPTLRYGVIRRQQSRRRVGRRCATRRAPWVDAVGSLVNTTQDPAIEIVLGQFCCKMKSDWYNLWYQLSLCQVWRTLNYVSVLNQQNFTRIVYLPMRRVDDNTETRKMTIKYRYEQLNTQFEICLILNRHCRLNS